jgi:hypothetical protein
VPLWDTTLGTGGLLLGGGTHPPTYTISNLHLFYPLNLLFLGLAERGGAVPLLALHWQHIAHYALAGLFAYAYGRSLRLSVPAAFVVGLVFAHSGFFASHVSHWTMIDAATWLPLILLLARRALEGSRPAALLGGLALAMAILAGYPAYVLLAGVAVGLQATWLAGWCLRDAGWRGLAAWSGMAGRLGLLALVGIGAAAVQLVPAWIPAAASHQALADFGFKAVGSLPPAALVGLLMPFPLRSLQWWRGNTSEYYLYAGALTLVLTAVALWRLRSRTVGFHALLGVVGLLLALGSHLELFRLLTDLVPGFGMFRYPSRSVLLSSLALATLAGLGLDALRTAAGPGLEPLVRGLRWGALMLLLALLGTLGLLVRLGETPHGGFLADLFGQEVMLLAWLGAGLLLLAAAERPGGRPWLVPVALAVLIVDLLFYAFPVPYTGADEGHHLRQLSPPARFLVAHPGSHRIGYDEGLLHPQQVYVHGWSVYDSESRFSPQSYIDLYERIGRNPRLLDLLGVRYLVRGKAPPARGRYADLHVGPGARQKVVPLDTLPAAPRAERAIRLVSHLAFAADVPQGAEVAQLLLRDGAGVETAWPIRAGIETAEWSIERASPPTMHRRAPVAASWPAPPSDQDFLGHDFVATFPLSPALTPAEIELRATHARSVLKVRQLEVAGRDLTADAGRFRQVGEQVWENRHALPRAFLVPRGRALPGKRELLQALEEFDPATEILLAGRPPPDLIAEGWTARGRIDIVRYTMHRVEVQAEVLERPQYLVLAEHFDRWWRADDNGRPAPILRVDHDLRAVRLEPGRHTVTFQLAYPLFAVGVAVSGATLLATGFALVAGARARRRPGGARS